VVPPLVLLTERSSTMVCKTDDLSVILDLARTQDWQKCGGCGAILVESVLEHLVYSPGPR
jgi:hypothetical protein